MNIFTGGIPSVVTQHLYLAFSSVIYEVLPKVTPETSSVAVTER